jgi:hypothetical protein
MLVKAPNPPRTLCSNLSDLCVKSFSVLVPESQTPQPLKAIAPLSGSASLVRILVQ